MRIPPTPGPRNTHDDTASGRTQNPFEHAWPPETSSGDSGRATQEIMTMTARTDTEWPQAQEILARLEELRPWLREHQADAEQQHRILRRPSNVSTRPACSL